MALSRVVIILCLALVDAIVVEHLETNINSSDRVNSDVDSKEESDLNNAFDGVYTECLMHLSYTCLQKKTLLYLKELEEQREISVIGDYVKFVKLNNSEAKNEEIEDYSMKSSEDLSHLIDEAVDNFFNNHLIRLTALGKDIVVPHPVEEFVGRKRRKGGGGGGGHGGGDDGGKKKMMMMAMMCMKMKLMMMVPAMMGMMGMMSFKGMMFSMMSFMISKMMLLMKLLEKKGGGGSGGGGGDGSWATGGGGGAWMPAGGQDYGGGGYDSNAQWSSRSILEKEEKPKIDVKPVTTYIKPVVTYNNPIDGKLFFPVKKINDAIIKANNRIDEPKSRRKRGLIEALQRAYMYWTNKVLGLNGYKQKRGNYPKYKMINGVKYMYYPIRLVQKQKSPKELPVNNVKTSDDTKPIVITDFNKGEIVEKGRMNRRKFHKMNENVSETVDENPWE